MRRVAVRDAAMAGRTHGWSTCTGRRGVGYEQLMDANIYEKTWKANKTDEVLCISTTGMYVM